MVPWYLGTRNTMAMLALIAACVAALAEDQAAALRALRDATSGTNSTDWVCNGTHPQVNCTAAGRVTGLDLGNLGLTGTLPTELGVLESLTRLMLFENRLSGSVPEQISELTALEYLDVTQNELSGTITSQIGLLGGLQDLWLGRNRLSGTIPSHIGQLGKLGGLGLEFNRLSGTIPTELALLTELPYLGVQYNALSKDVPDAVRRQCGERTWCFGLPPYGCSAFGDEYVAAASGGWETCVQCPPVDDDYTLKTVGPFAGILLVICVLAWVYVSAVQRYPDFKGWIATSSIIVSYARIVQFLAGELRDLGGPLMKTVYAVTSIGGFDWSTGRPECIMTKDDVDRMGFPGDIYAAAVVNWALLACLIGAYGALASIAGIYGCLGKCAKSDMLANKSVIVYHLQLFPAIQVGVRAITIGSLALESLNAVPGLSANQLTFAVLPVATFAAMLGYDLYIGAWMAYTVYRLEKARQKRKVVLKKLMKAKANVLRLSKRVSGRLKLSRAPEVTNDGSAASIPEPSACVQAEPSLSISRQVSSEEVMLVVGTCSRRKLSYHRLSKRLNFLTAKFGEHAPYWQFVKWLRGAFFILSGALSYPFINPTDLVWRFFSQAIGCIVVLLVFGVAHYRVQPYAKLYQNRLEMLLIVSSIAAIAISCAYPFVQDEAARIALDVAVFTVWFGPLLTLLGRWLVTWVMVKRRLRSSKDTWLEEFDSVDSPNRPRRKSIADIAGEASTGKKKMKGSTFGAGEASCGDGDIL